MMNDLIFICGHRKSGTSVFKSLFDGHDELLVYPIDLNLLYLYFPNFYKLNQDKETRKKRLSKILFEDLNYQLIALGVNSSFSIEELERLFFLKLDNKFDSLELIIDSLISSYAQITKKTNYIPVVKETSCEIYFSEIKSWFPNSKFIQLVRDPRDNFSSLKSGIKKHYSKLGEDSFHTLSSLIFRSRIGLEFGVILEENYPNDFLSVRFEDIVLNTDNELKKICNFLGINFKESLKNTSILENVYVGNNFDGKKFGALNSSNIQNWKKRISEDESKIIEFYLKKYIEYYGYKREYSDTECLESVSKFYEYENYKYYFNDRFL